MIVLLVGTSGGSRNYEMHKLHIRSFIDVQIGSFKWYDIIEATKLTQLTI